MEGLEAEVELLQVGGVGGCSWAVSLAVPADRRAWIKLGG